MTMSVKNSRYNWVWKIFYVIITWSMLRDNTLLRLSLLSSLSTTADSDSELVHVEKLGKHPTSCLEAPGNSQGMCRKSSIRYMFYFFILFTFLSASFNAATFEVRVSTLSQPKSCFIYEHFCTTCNHLFYITPTCLLLCWLLFVLGSGLKVQRFISLKNLVMSKLVTSTQHLISESTEIFLFVNFLQFTQEGRTLD